MSNQVAVNFLNRTYAVENKPLDPEGWANKYQDTILADDPIIVFDGKKADYVLRNVKENNYVLIEN